MSTNTRFWFSPLLLGLVIAILSLVGCSGDDGKDGIDGAPGAPGVDGTNAAIIIADIVPVNPVLDLSNTISYNQVSGAVTIHFFLTDGDTGDGIDITQDGYDFRILGSELIANNDGTAGQSWLQHFSENLTPATGAVPGTLTVVDAATGEYTYTTAATLPLNANVNRITMITRWREDIQGVHNVTLANPANYSYDFLQSDPGTELASSGADMVLTANCESCHGARINGVGHSRYIQVKTCNNCHNINYMGPRNGGEGDLAFMIHRIHDAGVFSTLHGGADFSEVTFPQNINTCNKCHGGAPEGNLNFEIMTSANCQSCHEDVDANVGTNHPAGAQPDSACTTCHTNGIVGSLPDIVTAHDDDAILAKTPENISEYAVNISMTPPANGTNYVAGVDLPPLVTVTLTPKAGQPAAVYDADQDVEGVVNGQLSTANLFVYGPRAAAVPVLTTNSSTDPALVGTPTQGHSLFLADRTATPNPDGQVVTDATGYKYQLMDNLADLEPGTYMVRFEGLDYDTPAGTATDYVTASTAVINFQVGTATEEHKLSGSACTNCHGATIMHLTGAHPHHQPFNTDGCLACHDKSGNYGDYIGNRVHAVHSASTTGDLHNRDWSEVTFPQTVNNCTICHTDTTTDTPVWRNPNEVACGGCHGADPNVVPADWPLVDPDRINKEAAAATHMLLMGGTFDVTTLDQPRQCIVCHGEGRIADLYDTHHLILFPPPVVPQP